MESSRTLTFTQSELQLILDALYERRNGLDTVYDLKSPLSELIVKDMREPFDLIKRIQGEMIYESV